ncbi:MAG: hypothetical protein GEU79_00645 [Acidimicrobiia bacterium]|nr:hypothetical protein [Acidimicrobiia bacterium]
MSRVRISTTVDGRRLERARDLLAMTDSELIDHALKVMINAVVAERETDALARLPYESDPDLAWEAPSGPALPYDGDVPPEVRARVRRSQSR